MIYFLNLDDKDNALMKILVFNGSFGVKKTLDIVINSAKENQVDRIICLGDLIGVGNENLECLEIAKSNEIQMVSGTFEAIITGQIEKNQIENSLLKNIEKSRMKISKQDLLWLSNMKRLTLLDNLLFMYGNYIDRYALFEREDDFSETDLITRKKHPMLDGILIGSSNQQSFYNGKRLIQIRTKRQYEYSNIKNAKFIASPGRMVSILRTGDMKSGWLIVDTDKKIIDFLTEKNPLDDGLTEINSYDLESVFSNY